MRLTFVAPKLTGRQKTGTGLLCSSASVLFIAPSALLPFAEVGAQTLLGGLVIPAGVAAVFWLTKAAADENDRKTSVEAAEAREAARIEQQRAERRRPSPRPRPTRVLEGEVLPR